MKDRFKLIFVALLMVLTLGFISCTEEIQEPPAKQELTIIPVLEGGLTEESNSKHIEPTLVAIANYKVDLCADFGPDQSKIVPVGEQIYFQFDQRIHDASVKVTALNKDGKKIGFGSGSLGWVEENSAMSLTVNVSPSSASASIDISINGVKEKESELIQLSLLNADGRNGVIGDIVRIYDTETSSLVLHLNALPGYYELIIGGVEGKVAIHDSLRILGEYHYSLAVNNNKVYIDDNVSVNKNFSSCMVPINALNYVLSDEVQWDCPDTWTVERWFLDGKPIENTSSTPGYLSYGIPNSVLSSKGEGLRYYAALRSLTSNIDGQPVTFHVVSAGQLNVIKSNAPDFNAVIPAGSPIWNENFSVSLNIKDGADPMPEHWNYKWYVNGESIYGQTDCRNLVFNLKNDLGKPEINPVEIELRGGLGTTYSLWKHTFEWVPGFNVTVKPGNITRWKSSPITLSVAAEPENAGLGTDKLRWNWRCTDTDNSVLATTYTTSLSETVDVPASILLVSGDNIEIDCDLVAADGSVKRNIGIVTGLKLIDPPTQIALTVTGDSETSITADSVKFNRHDGSLVLDWAKPSNLVDAYEYHLLSMDNNGVISDISTDESLKTFNMEDRYWKEGEYHVWIELRPIGKDYIFESNRIQFTVGPHARSGKLTTEYYGTYKFRFDWNWVERDPLFGKPISYSVNVMDANGIYQPVEVEHEYTGRTILTYTGSSPIVRYQFIVHEEGRPDLVTEGERNIGTGSVEIINPETVYLNSQNESYNGGINVSYRNTWNYFKYADFDYVWKINDVVQSLTTSEGYLSPVNGECRITCTPVMKYDHAVDAGVVSEPVIAQGIDIRNTETVYTFEKNRYLIAGQPLNLGILDNDGQTVGRKATWFVNNYYIGTTSDILNTHRIGNNREVIAVILDSNGVPAAYAKGVIDILGNKEAYITSYGNDAHRPRYRASSDIRVAYLINSGIWNLYCDNKIIAENLDRNGEFSFKGSSIIDGRHVIRLVSQENPNVHSNDYLIATMPDLSASLSFEKMEQGAYSYSVGLIGHVTEDYVHLDLDYRYALLGRSGKDYSSSVVSKDAYKFIWNPGVDKPFDDFPLRLVYDVTASDGATAHAESTINLDFDISFTPYVKNGADDAQKIKVTAVENNLGDMIDGEKLTYRWKATDERGNEQVVESATRTAEFSIVGDTQISLEVLSAGDGMPVCATSSITAKPMTISDNCTSLDAWDVPLCIKTGRVNRIRFNISDDKMIVAFFKLHGSERTMVAYGMNREVICPDFGVDVVDYVDITIYAEGDVPGVLSQKTQRTIPVGMGIPEIRIQSPAAKLNETFTINIYADWDAKLESAELFASIDGQDKLIGTYVESGDYWKILGASAFGGIGKYTVYLKTTNQYGSLVSDPVTIEVLAPVPPAPSVYGELFATEPIEFLYYPDFDYDKYELIENGEVLLSVIPDPDFDVSVKMSLPPGKMTAGKHNVFVRCHFNGNYFDSASFCMDVKPEKPVNISWKNGSLTEFTDDDSLKVSIDNYQSDGTSYVIKCKDCNFSKPMSYADDGKISLQPGKHIVFVEATKGDHKTESNKLQIEVKPVADPVFSNADSQGFTVTGGTYDQGKFTVECTSISDEIWTKYFTESNGNHRLNINGINNGGIYNLTITYTTRAGRAIEKKVEWNKPYDLTFHISSRLGGDGPGFSKDDYTISVGYNGNVDRTQVNSIALVGEKNTWKLNKPDDYYQPWENVFHGKLDLATLVTVRVDINGTIYEYPGQILTGNLEIKMDKTITGLDVNDDKIVHISLLNNGLPVKSSDIPAGYELVFREEASVNPIYHSLDSNYEYDWNLSKKKGGWHRLSVILRNGENIKQFNEGIACFKVDGEASSLDLIEPVYKDRSEKIYTSGDSIKLKALSSIEAVFKYKGKSLKVIAEQKDAYGNVWYSEGWSAPDDNYSVNLGNYGSELNFKGDLNIKIYLADEYGKVVAKSKDFILNIKEIVPGLDIYVMGGMMPMIMTDNMMSIAINDFDPNGEYSWFVQQDNGDEIPLEVELWIDDMVDYDGSKYHLFVAKTPNITGEVKFIGKLDNKIWDEKITIIPNQYTLNGTVTEIEGGLRYSLPEGVDLTRTMIMGESGITDIQPPGPNGLQFQIMEPGVSVVEMKTKLWKLQPKVCTFMAILMSPSTDTHGGAPEQIDMVFTQFNDFEIINSGMKYSMVSKSDPCNTEKYEYEWIVDGEIMKGKGSSIELTTSPSNVTCKAFAIIPNLSMVNMSKERTFEAEWVKPVV